MTSAAALKAISAVSSGWEATGFTLQTCGCVCVCLCVCVCRCVGVLADCPVVCILFAY